MWSVPNVNHVSGTDRMNLACPARFERATYALEEFVAVRMSIYFNGLQHKISLCNKSKVSLICLIFMCFLRIYPLKNSRLCLV
jgi:hypothetical protein